MTKFVPTKFVYDLANKRKLRPKLKFKGWHILVICRHCGKIIDKKFTLFGLFRYAESLFCTDCAMEMLMKIFKIYTNKHEETEAIVEEFAEKN
jgi:superfamily II helicase